MTSIDIRPARPADLDAVVELQAEMFRAMGSSDLSGQWRANARRWFAARLADPAYGIFVVTVDDEVVATAMGAVRDAAPSPAVPDGRDVLISNVCTAPEHRGAGHAHRAFEAVLAWADATGVRRTELMATDAGRGMYERAGFRVTTFPAMRRLVGG